jgi:tRNA(Ile)-lysidine synthase
MRTSPELVAGVAEFLRQESIPVRGIVVAVSGGPDSIALLNALVDLRAESLVIAHLNHQLRGAESDDDEAFVRANYERLAAQNSRRLRFCSERIDVANVLEAGGDNLEAVARQVRYGWLGKVAAESSCAFIATGHTANDQAETVLHHLLRGTGLKGLRGIARRREVTPGVELIRPLLNVRREQVVTYLNSNAVAYRLDSSNDNLDFTRNRIRHELLPQLATTYNPEIIDVLSRLAVQAADVYDEVEAHALQVLVDVELPRAADQVVLKADSLKQVPRNLLREMCRRIWARERWPMGSMGFRDWDRLAEFLTGNTAALDLPNGLHARRRAQVVLLSADS